MNKLIAEALQRVSELEGVVDIRTEDFELGFMGGHVDDYILVHYLGDLLKRGEMTIEINPPERINFIKELLKMEK